jgi:hypothetical protein
VPPRAYISHHIPGRVRIKIPEAKRNRALLERIRESILSAPGVETVDCNPLTGSVLIRYSPPVHENFSAFLAFLSSSNGSITPLSLEPVQSSRPARKVRRRAAREREPSEAAKAITEFFGDLDDVIRAATGDQLDLKILLPLAAAALGITLLPKARGTPLWLTLMIFAFSSFLMLHEPVAAEAEAAEIVAGLEL